MNPQPTPGELFIHCHREMLTCINESCYGGVYQNAKECFYAFLKLDKEAPSLYRMG